MGFIKTVPLEESFLRVFEKPKKVRLSKQVIDVNYAHLSPFKGGGHLFFQTDSSIYVWYLREPADANGIQVPEGYLLYRFFKERGDAVVLLPRDKALNALVIGQGELRAQVTLQNDADPAKYLDMLGREFSLRNPELVRLEPSARFSPKAADLLAFAHFELKPFDLLEKGVALAKGPIIAALLVSAGFTLYQEQRLEATVAEKKSQLDRLKRDNGSVQSSVERVHEQSAFWRSFIDKEQAYPDVYRLLAQVTDVMQRHGGYLNSVELSENRLTVLAGLKSSEAAIIKDLLATSLFEDVKLLASRKDPARPEFKVYNLAMILRPLPKRGDT